MTRIRATCPTCGEVDLRPADVSLEIVRTPQDAEAEVRDGSNYCFECPACDVLITKPADARIAKLLTTGGVAVHIVPSPAGSDVLVRDRQPHPEGDVDGPPLTFDDLIDFHFLLRSDDLLTWAFEAADGRR